LNLGGAASDELRGNIFPLKILMSFPRRADTIQSEYTATQRKSPEIFSKPLLREGSFSPVLELS